MYLSVFSIVVLVAGLLSGVTSCDQVAHNAGARLQPTCKAKWYDESMDSTCYGLQRELRDSVVIGDLQTVTESIDRGANVNGGFDQSIPVLEVAAALGKTEVVKLLLKAGADINLVRPLGQTALKAAVTRQRVDTAKVLIEEGADVCEKTESSALEFALKDGNSELIAILERGGAKDCS